jgi:hypothetical protein
LLLRLVYRDNRAVAAGTEPDAQRDAVSEGCRISLRANKRAVGFASAIYQSVRKAVTELLLKLADDVPWFASLKEMND